MIPITLRQLNIGIAHAQRTLHGRYCACASCKPHLEPEEQEAAIKEARRFNENPEHRKREQMVNAMIERAKAS